MRKQLANIITISRILCSIGLLCCPVFSFGFYAVYLFCGFTDTIDGTIARKTKTISEFGARIDTAADIVFVAVCLVKILPLIHLPAWEAKGEDCSATVRAKGMVRVYADTQPDIIGFQEMSPVMSDHSPVFVDVELY